MFATAQSARRAMTAALVLGIVGLTASAQTFTPLAFGPLGTAPGGTYYTNTSDISSDGRYVLATLNTGEQRYITPTGTYTLSGTGGPIAISADGQMLVGGQTNSNPQRWRLSAVANNNIVSENITWPGGPVAFGPAYGVQGGGNVAAIVGVGVSVVGPFGRVTAQSAFTAIDPFGTAGAFRGLAADVPVMAILGSLAGNPTNGYRWNFSTGAVTPLTMPAGGTSISPVGNGSGISNDAGIIVGTANIGTASRPYYWDASGTPVAIPTLAGSIISSALSVNGSGTLIGGAANFPLSVRHAYLYSIATGQTIDLHNAFSDAGLLPTGWTLTATQHISDDGSRIFCLATAPDGTTRSVLLGTNLNVPTPGATALLGLGGVLATRRRR